MLKGISVFALGTEIWILLIAIAVIVTLGLTLLLTFTLPAFKAFTTPVALTVAILSSLLLYATFLFTSLSGFVFTVVVN